MTPTSRTAEDYVAAIAKSKKTIFDEIEVDSPLFIPTPILQDLLEKHLAGFSTAGMAIKTRSKRVKEKVAEILGYPIPQTFTKCQPRFFGQNFDTYVQSSNNLQVWNEELSPTRRYVLIRQVDDMLTKVRVVTGATLTKLDRTGTLTQKHQARLNEGKEPAELVSKEDVEAIWPLLSEDPPTGSPVDYPQAGKILPIAEVFARIRGLVGVRFPDAGIDQERNRGAALHQIVCEALGFTSYKDDGQFPDVKSQILEVKLQTAATIDLGLVSPSSEASVNFPKLNEIDIRQCDIRYALFGAETDGQEVTITRVYLVTGKDFYSRFPKFGGMGVNKKLQIPLPANFFNEAKRAQDLLL